MRTKSLLRTTLAASALLIAFQIGLTPDNIGISQVYAEKPVISFNTGNPGIQTPFVQPSWSVKVDNWYSFYTSSDLITTAEGKVFTFRDQKLIALNAQTGKTIWTFNDHVYSLFVYHEGVIYGNLIGGDLFALSASSGKKLWQSSVKIERPNAIEAFGDTLYALIDNYTFAVHVKTGKQLWVNSGSQDTTEPKEAYYTSSGMMDAGDILLRAITLNEPTQTTRQLHAIDKKTGKTLWNMNNQDAPFKIEGGLAYSIIYNNQPIVDDAERSITVNVINVKTGQIKGSRDYRWNVTTDSYNEYGGNAPHYLNGNDFYIHQNGIIARYDFKNYKPGGKPLQTYGEPSYNQGSPLYKVHRGRILFRTRQDSLFSIKTVNGQDMSWTGDNPSALTAIYGKGVYLAQTDGILHAIDFDSGKPQFRVKTGARQYDQILKEDGFLIIQTPGKLIGVKLPSAFK
ncbi:PQQ-binding-like beta-propeller repeat protein [Paenibacillus sp. 2TAB23]|uniref:outer membrane protein assembly factor BamB family protein n=1 Tax=Paenibacillus sp. 2TAB23 TaxID=3233004 RepID=UPI003F981333